MVVLREYVPMLCDTQSRLDNGGYLLTARSVVHASGTLCIPRVSYVMCHAHVAPSCGCPVPMHAVAMCCFVR